MQSTARHRRTNYVEIGAAFAVLIGILVILNQLNFLPQQFAVSDEMSYPFIFVIGLVASISTCIAVTGGLLVAIAAKYNQAHANLASIQRLKPHIYFNAGRIISYTLFGGAIGALGSALAFAPEVNGVLTILASVVMILLGLQMLKAFPSLTRLMPATPRIFYHFIHDLAERRTKGGAFVLGAATFFLPCGFTQALQLYVLSKGSATVGACAMLSFALGTLPALMSLSALSSFATGAFQKHFVRIAAVAVVVLGIVNVQYGLVLMNGRLGLSLFQDGPQQADSVSVERTTAGAKQIAVMKIIGFGYFPNQFKVRQGVPVEWRIDASEAAGCGRVLIAPALGVRQLLSDNSTTIITFTPDRPGEFGFNCGMGMMTPDSKFIVTAKRG